MTTRVPSRSAQIATALLALSVSASEEPATAIVGAALIDGTGAPPVEDSIVVVRGERIVASGPRAAVPIPEGATVLDAAGKFLMPGLVDLHNHYGGGADGLRRAWALQLEFGVTTVRSLGADPPANLAVIADARAGQFPAPRIYTAGAGFSHPGGTPPGAVINRPTTVAEAQATVRQLAAAGVDFIKMWVDPTMDGRLEWNGGKAPIPKISEEIRTALVEEAARHGIPTVAHVFEEADVRQLHSAGVRDFVHTARSAPVDDAFVAWARREGLSFAPALGKAQDLWYLPEHPETLDDPGFAKAFGAERLERLRAPGTLDEMRAHPQAGQLRMVFARMQRFVGQMQAGGVTVALGSDSGTSLLPFGWGTHHELQALVDAGLTPLQAIRAGTSSGARVLEGDDADFGTIAPGKAADLILLADDPTADITHSRSIEGVMQAGQWLAAD